MSKKYNIDERAQKQWENYSIFSIVHALVEKNKDNGLFNISLKYYPQPLYPDIADVYDENNPAYKSLKNILLANSPDTVNNNPVFIIYYKYIHMIQVFYIPYHRHCILLIPSYASLYRYIITPASL